MNKVLEVREFDTITCNDNYKEDPFYTYLDASLFSALEALILEDSGLEDSETIDFLKLSAKKNVGKVIQARNYVGLIQLKNGFQIQILPKIYGSSIEETKKTFLSMLRSMKDFPSKIYSDANLKIDRMNLYEIFISMYLQEVQWLVKKGLKSAYTTKEDNLNYYKGKLKVSEHIKQNTVHRERFYVEYDEFTINRPENRLIKSTLQKLQKLTSSYENSKKIRQILCCFENVQSSQNYIKDFSRIVSDRSIRDYNTIMQWSKVFLLNQSFSTFAGDTSAKSLLFPMEKVFESYVARKMKKIFGDSGWVINVQDKGYYLFDTPRKFALRPDIVVTNEDGKTIIMDTKWKRLNNNERKNYGISQSDMYQMFAYAKKYKTKDIWLLYPLDEEMKDHKEISFSSSDIDEGEIDVIIRVFFIDIEHIEESLEFLNKKIAYLLEEKI